jgi:hypothetical protein
MPRIATALAADALDSRCRCYGAQRSTSTTLSALTAVAHECGREHGLGNNRRKIREINLLLGNYSAVREKGYRKSIAESA